MTVDAEESVLTIIENGRIALQRNFNFGMDQLLANAVERLSVTEEYDSNESPDDRRARLMLRVKQIFADEELLKTQGVYLLSVGFMASIHRPCKSKKRPNFPITHCRIYT